MPLRCVGSSSGVLMSIKALPAIALLALLATGHAYAKCTSPSAPKIPRGKTAALEQMQAAQKSVKAFDAAINDYVSCLQAESDAQVAKFEERETDPKKKEEHRKKAENALIKKQNAAIDKDKALAERFNEQLRA